MTREPASLRVHCVAGSAERAETIEALARVLVPTAQCSHPGSPAMPERAPQADVAIIDADGLARTTEGGAAASAVPPELEAVRRLRAGGFAGEIIVLTETIAPPESTIADDLSRLGASRVTTAGLAGALTAAFVTTLEPHRTEPDNAQLLTQLGRTRQLLSAGEIALGLQHSMNNPLAAILAESQLLEMDALSTEQREAVARIVALCRRMTAIVRRLDGVGGSAGGAPPPASDR